MSQAPFILVIILGLSALLLIFLSAWARLHARVPGAGEFSWLFLAVSLYALGYAFELSRTDLESVLQALRMEYLGVAPVPSFVLMFALHYTRGKPVAGWLKAVLLVIPCITIFLVFTVQYHSWYYINPHMINGEYFPVISFERGPWYYVHVSYLLLGTASSAVILLRYALQAKGKKKQQALTMVAGTSAPLISGTAYVMGLIPNNIDSAPFSLVILGLINSFALFKLDLFELVPAARAIALDSIRDSFLVVDKNGIVQDYNQATLSLSGAEKIKIGDHLDETTLGKDLSPLLRGDSRQIEFTIRPPDGGINFFIANAYPIQSQWFSSKGMCILIRDVTENVNLMQKLRNQANLDGLTGLFNRRCLMELGERELEFCRQNRRMFGVMIIDLDHFKSVNDRYGHAAGDAVLKQVAASASQGLREGDILGRYGGEEFAVFLPGANLNTSLLVAERLRNIFLNMTIPDWKEIKITASLGVRSEAVQGSTTLENMLQKADEALYRAKHQGRNQVCSSSDKE